MTTRRFRVTCRLCSKLSKHLILRKIALCDCVRPHHSDRRNAEPHSQSHLCMSGDDRQYSGLPQKWVAASSPGVVNHRLRITPTYCIIHGRVALKATPNEWDRSEIWQTTCNPCISHTKMSVESLWHTCQSVHLLASKPLKVHTRHGSGLLLSGFVQRQSAKKLLHQAEATQESQFDCRLC